jgi:FkbM family methyltransferase
MKQKVISSFRTFRRNILKIIIPEFFWPKAVHIDGVHFNLRGTPYSFGTKMVLKKGAYEVSERKLLKQLLRPSDTVIELGGSIGILTAIISKLIPEGRIVSVEASEKISRFSKSWLEEKSNVKVITGFGFPVFELAKKIKITNFDESLGSLGGTAEFLFNENADFDARIYDLKKIIDSFQLEPTILLVDIEGSERVLIEQKAKFPTSLRGIIIELHPHMYESSVLAKIIHSIQDEGFQLICQDSNVYMFKKPD